MPPFLITGIGGLGCLLAEILVRSGIGKVYLCDNGIIEKPDLNRQILYTHKDIGKRKANIVVKRLSKIHSFTEIIPVDVNTKDENFIIPSDISGVADCLDNFESRFVLWDKLLRNKFYVHGCVERFYGQVVTLIKGSSPTLRDIFSNYKVLEGPIPVCAHSVSVISSIAATEVVKNIFNEPVLFNRMLLIDLSDFTFTKLDVK